MRPLELRAQGIMRDYVTSGDAHAWSALENSLNELIRGGDFAAALGILEEAVETSPQDPLLHYNAARVCEAWGDELVDEHFARAPGRSMSPWEWMFGQGTPYPQFKELRRRAIAFYQRVLELDPDLDPTTRDVLEEKIFWFGWA